MSVRRKGQGIATIARLNWPAYAMAGLVMAVSLAVVTFESGILRVIGSSVFFVSFYFGALRRSHQTQSDS